MAPCVLEKLVGFPEVETARAYPFGRVSPWLVNIDKKLPPLVARWFSFVINAMGLLQPFTIKALSPMLVLEIRKGAAK